MYHRNIEIEILTVTNVQPAYYQPIKRYIMIHNNFPNQKLSTQGFRMSKISFQIS